MIVGNTFKVESVAEAYKEIGNVLLKGDQVSPRGIETKELIAPQIILMHPRRRLVYNKKRKFNLMHALNESMMLFSESDKVKDIGRFNSSMKKFSDNGETMNGAYGTRVAPYIRDIIAKLKSDESSRQAVLRIYDNKDLIKKTKDVPCTETLQFIIRNGKLHLITTMRSNDILYGFQYDVVMFTMLQETIANTLGIDVGYYIHQPASLHIYKDYKEFNGYDMLNQMASHGDSVRAENDGTIYDWYKLMDNVTNGTSHLLSGTTMAIQYMFMNEFIYRNLKEHTLEISKQSKRYFHRVTSNIPEWAQPFLKRWKNL